MVSKKVRSKVLTRFGASGSEREELLAYNENRFDLHNLPSPLEIPLADEDFVATWQRYAREALEIGAYHVLQRALVQFSFPVRKGISATEGYRAVVLKGASPDLVFEAGGLEIHRPERLAIFLHPTLAGRIPVIVAGDRADFETLVRALAMRNEPLDVPHSMGATIVSGYNNWDRIRAYRKKWASDHAGSPDEEQWQNEFSRIMPLKNLYQDRFIIAGEGPYSGVPAEDMGFPEEDWQSVSRSIRIEHESTHYATKRLFQSARNNLLDEMIADYFGIVAAAGSYRADWFLRFMGLERYPRYRRQGRLENYRGKPPLSRGAFRILQRLVREAAGHLERFHSDCEEMLEGSRGKFLMLMTLTRLSLEALACEEAGNLLAKTVQDVARDLHLERRQAVS